MRQFFPVEELARDQRFSLITMQDRMADGRGRARTPKPTDGEADAGTAKTAKAKAAAANRRSSNRLTPERKDSSDAARSLMHGIFVGEIEALEGAGRTCWDFTTQGTRRVGPTETAPADTSADVPFALKLDMARQCWDEARHVEISVKLSEWMGTEIGQYAENTVLFEAACSHDAVLRLAGVNRALEGLAIDVFTTMKEFGDLAGDPVLEFCEDWMLADEVTHVKMGSDWLRRLTEGDPDRRKKALEFQSVVDKLFSFGGTRSESEESPIGLARRFRELAGFDEDEVNEIAELSRQALEEARTAQAQVAARAAAAAQFAAAAETSS
jgi:uncharacterized ferritin-like protein (DUF455 family)